MSHPAWFTHGAPPRDDCVLPRVLAARAALHPDRVLVRFDDGATWTWAAGPAAVRRAAGALQALGVRRGDRVLVWAPNGRANLLAWFGANWLGAIYVPINTAYRGSLLAHVIANAEAEIIVAHRDLIPRLGDVPLGTLKTVIATGQGEGAAVAGLTLLDEAVLDQGAPAEPVTVEPWEPYGIIYTSGTTGPSKGVLCPHFHLYTTSVVTYGYMGPDDRCLVTLPMFHVGGTTSIGCAIYRGASFAFIDGFSVGRFWDQLRDTGSTTCAGLVGVMAEFLLKAPAGPADRGHGLRMVNIIPVSDTTIGFARRFGVDYVTGFNMTEISSPLVAPLNSSVRGSCGRPRDGVECRIVDEHDLEVPRGQVGELIVRTDLPWAMNAGYWNNPAASAAAWRNGWFHTGDAFRQDADGNYFFVDRMKDTIRRRGENISSLEVEQEVAAHPAVREAAVYAVPGPGGEEEVMAAIALVDGQTIDPAALIRHLADRLPYFMVPRYLRILPELPRTPTAKVRKVELKGQGLTPDTFDREAAGITLARERLR